MVEISGRFISNELKSLLLSGNLSEEFSLSNLHKDTSDAINLYSAIKKSEDYINPKGELKFTSTIVTLLTCPLFFLRIVRYKNAYDILLAKKKICLSELSMERMNIKQKRDELQMLQDLTEYVKKQLDVISEAKNYDKAKHAPRLILDDKKEELIRNVVEEDSELSRLIMDFEKEHVFKKLPSFLSIVTSWLCTSMFQDKYINKLKDCDCDNIPKTIFDLGLLKDLIKETTDYIALNVAYGTSDKEEDLIRRNARLMSGIINKILQISIVDYEKNKDKYVRDLLKDNRMRRLINVLTNNNLNKIKLSDLHLHLC